MLSRLIVYVPQAWKAVAAAATAGSGAYAGAIDGGVTGPEWIVVIAVALAAGFAVWRVPNKASA